MISAFSMDLFQPSIPVRNAVWVVVIGLALMGGRCHAVQVKWFWSGATTDSSFQVKAKAFSDGSVVRLIVSTSPDLTYPTYSEPATSITDQNNGIVTLLVTGLLSATQYYYGFEINGLGDTNSVGMAKTFPSGASSFTLAFGSCAQTGSTNTVFETIRELHPDLFFHLGDMHYQNIASNDMNLYRQAYESILASPVQAALYHEVTTAYIWDDHDYGPNNSDSTSLSRLAARVTYQEVFPHYPLAAGSGNVSINYAFTIGRVRFIVCDSRSARSPAGAADTPAKTMLGQSQKAWFRQQLLRANGRFPLIVWINTLPWIGSTGDDGWYLYTNERRELADFIEQNHIRGLCMLSGDAHMIAIDDGTNSDYATAGGAAFPVFHAAALDQTGSLKGGPYSHGAFPGRGQFGLMFVADDGDSTITVSWSGRDQNNLEIVAYSFSVPTVEIVCGDADGNGSIELGDPIFLIEYIFADGQPPLTLSNGDSNSSGVITISDAVLIVRYLMFGGAIPRCD